jgi:AmiR/NasT family two-component response regulator
MKASRPDRAERVLMSTMHIGQDAAFAALVAASKRENVTLHTIAERIAGALGRPADWVSSLLGSLLL